MRTLLPVSAFCLLLGACGYSPPLPEEPDIDINGTYLGRIVGPDQRSALLDVTLNEQNLTVTATVTSQATGQRVTLTGTRSVYRASPVTVNATSEVTAPDSPCERRVTERYAVAVTFYAANGSRDEGARGSARHEVCDPATRLLRPVSDGTGELELIRR